MTRPPASPWGSTLAVALLLGPIVALSPAAAQEAKPSAQQPPDAAQKPPGAAQQPAAPPTRPTSELLELAVNEQTGADQEAAASQERISEIDDETQKLLGQYRTAVGEKESIEAYSAQLEIQIQSQVKDIDSIQTQLQEVETTAREVLPLTQKMLDTLAEFVALDVPFLSEERQKRIATLKDVMARADVSLSEKYRRVVEAYQIEMEYGRTVDAYEGRLGDGPEARTVQFLRIGRVSLMYQTLDGNETGFWDADDKKWVVDDDFRQAFKHGLDIAKKISAPDLLVVPVHAPKEEKS
jgi:hypothetical protein